METQQQHRRRLWHFRGKTEEKKEEGYLTHFNRANVRVERELQELWGIYSLCLCQSASLSVGPPVCLSLKLSPHSLRSHNCSDWPSVINFHSPLSYPKRCNLKHQQIIPTFSLRYEDVYCKDLDVWLWEQRGSLSCLSRGWFHYFPYMLRFVFGSFALAYAKFTLPGTSDLIQIIYFFAHELCMTSHRENNTHHSCTHSCVRKYSNSLFARECKSCDCSGTCSSGNKRLNLKLN